MLTEKHIVLGVTGGIAAYKALDLTSKLKKLGATVDIIMTKSATEFVSPLTFQSIAHTKVVTDMFEAPKYMEIEHISLAQKADVFVVVPATANIIGKIANGIADDMLSTTVMATEAPILIAPAMNTKMYENIIVQRNIEKLKLIGYHFIDPISGRLACDDVGKGKLADVDDIVLHIKKMILPKQRLLNKRIVITAGPTVEPIDPVRFLSNRSTGKMGYALAEVARDMGADVVLLSGPTALDVPKGIQYERFMSADNLLELALKHKDNADVFISVAAVADYKPASFVEQKIKKAGDLTLKLVRNPDIAMTIGRDKGKLISVGFSAESENILENSKIKLEKKHFDLIVINDIKAKDAGFGVDTNIVTLMGADGSIERLEKMSKREVSEHILKAVADIIKQRELLC